MLGWGETIGSPIGVTGFQILQPAFATVCGFGLGFLVSRSNTKLALTGKWVWVLPTTALVTCIVLDWQSGFGSEIWNHYFWWSGDGESPLLRDFLT